MYNAKIISESVLHIGISFMEMLIMMYILMACQKTYSYRILTDLDLGWY